MSRHSSCSSELEHVVLSVTRITFSHTAPCSDDESGSPKASANTHFTRTPQCVCVCSLLNQLNPNRGVRASLNLWQERRENGGGRALCSHHALLTPVTSRTSDQVLEHREHTPAGGQTTSTAGTGTHAAVQGVISKESTSDLGKVVRGEAPTWADSCRVCRVGVKELITACPFCFCCFFPHNLRSDHIYFWCDALLPSALRLCHSATWQLRAQISPVFYGVTFLPFLH